jgi:hypothetical protein
MNLNELFKLVGKVHVTVTNEHGEIVEQLAANTVMTVGKNFTASRMVGVASNVMSHMALGSSSANPTDPAQTALGAELGRVALTASTATTNVVTYTATFGTGVATGAVTEAGIFNATPAGTMLCRVVFAVVNKGANDTIAITWTVTVG